MADENGYRRAISMVQKGDLALETRQPRPVSCWSEAVVRRVCRHEMAIWERGTGPSCRGTAK
jgi:hypothetical protein